MRFVFVHQNFPGQFLHLVRHLVRAGGNEVVFITEENSNVIAGVRKVTYRVPAGRPTPVDAVELDGAMARAAAVAEVGGKLKALGYQPDMIIGHHGWGEMLNLGDVWPGVPVLGYFEFFYRTEGLDVGFDPEFPMHPSAWPRVRAKNAVNLLALTNPGWGQTPTTFQHRTYPEWAQRRIAVLPEGVDLEVCRPAPEPRRGKFSLNGFEIGPDETLLTFVARDLEPYRGFHILMRALPAMLRARPKLKAIVVGGDDVSYGARLEGMTWREFMLRQVGGELDLGRVAFPGKIEYAAFLALLQRSDVHVYLTYPFVASWSLREALACGCAIVASDTAPVHEFIDDGVSGVLTPFLDPARLAERVLELLEDRALAERVRQGARVFAERYLRLEDTLGHYLSLIDKIMTYGGR